MHRFMRVNEVIHAAQPRFKLLLCDQSDVTVRPRARYNNLTGTDRWKDRWINRATVWMDELADEKINRWTDRKADETLMLLIKAERERWTDRLINRSADGQTHRLSSGCYSLECVCVCVCVCLSVSYIT